MPVDINELIIKTSVNNAADTSSVRGKDNYRDIEKIKKIILEECHKMIKEEIEMDKIR